MSRQDGDTVLTEIKAGTRLHDIARESGWEKGEVTRLARENGYGLNVSSDRFQPAPQARPRPAGVTRVGTSLDSVPVANAGDRPAPSAGVDVRPGVRDILAEGRASKNKTTRRLTEAACTALGRLQKHLDDTREKEAKAAKVRELEAALSAAKAELRGDAVAERPAVDSKAVRAWAATTGVSCPATGRVPAAVVEQYNAAVAS